MKKSDQFKQIEHSKNIINYVGKSKMINIKCEKCGWTLPFIARARKDNVCGRRSDDVECPKCGKLLIRKGGNVKRWY